MKAPNPKVQFPKKLQCPSSSDSTTLPLLVGLVPMPFGNSQIDVPKGQLNQPQRFNAVSVCRGHCASERNAAFTPLPLGTLCVALRIFPSGGKGSTVKRPEGRAPGALGWGAKQILNAGSPIAEAQVSKGRLKGDGERVQSSLRDSNGIDSVPGIETPYLFSALQALCCSADFQLPLGIWCFPHD